MALLHALCLLQQDIPFCLQVIHVQHGLRGEESLADECFVLDACRALQVPCCVENAGLSGSMDTPGMETLARDSRRRIFESYMQSHRMDAILFAHHQDDQAETVLMHLLRGAGAEGLRGMHNVGLFGGGKVIRPFLAFDKQALMEALEQAGLSWREDRSNQQPVTLRNILRMEVLPRLETLVPGAAAHMAAAAQRLDTDEQYLSQQADCLYQAAAWLRAPIFALRQSLLREAPQAIRRRVLRRWWREAAGEMPERSLSFEDTLRLSCLCEQAAGNLNLPGGLQASVHMGWLHMTRQSGDPVYQPKPLYWVPDGAGCDTPLGRISVCPATGKVPASPRCAVLPLGAQAVLRTPLPNDRIHPLGAPGAKPLRRFLTDRKVAPVLRKALPVLACGSDIWWIPGMALGEALRVTPTVPNGVQLILQGDEAFWIHT